jgi:hypothetical protein
MPLDHAPVGSGLAVLNAIAVQILNLLGGQRSGGAGEGCVFHDVPQTAGIGDVLAAQDQGCADITGTVGGKVRPKAIA